MTRLPPRAPAAAQASRFHSHGVCEPRLGLLANVRGTFFSNWLLNPATGTRALGYNLWDFYISKDLPHGTQAYFSIDNFMDSRDEKLSLSTPGFDRPDYGRQYRVGLRWRIGGVE